MHPLCHVLTLQAAVFMALIGSLEQCLNATGRAGPYDDTYRVTIEKRLSFHIMLYRLFCCVANHSSRQYFLLIG